MNRELNPHLFGTPGGQPAGASASGAGGLEDSPQLQESTPVPALPAPREAAAPGYIPLEIKALEGQLQATRAQVGAVDQKLEAMVSNFYELTRVTNARLERFAVALKRLEEAQAQQHQELGAKNAVLAGKVNERKVNDDKILDLIERHNILVRNFENRLVTLQRTLSEQELQLHASNSALEEARQELAKLKGL